MVDYDLWQGVNLNQQSAVNTAHECAYHCAQLSYSTEVIILQPTNYCCLQCFDAVGWAAGRVSGL